MGNPAEPLVRALRERVGAAADSVHLGATSQDVVDTAAMLVSRSAIGLVLADLDRSPTDARSWRVHRSDADGGAHAAPAGGADDLRAEGAGWLVGVLEARRRLATVRDERLAALGGAAGTLAALGDDALDVDAALRAGAWLAEPVLPWHGNRQRLAELAAALDGAAGARPRSASTWRCSRRARSRSPRRRAAAP